MENSINELTILIIKFCEMIQMKKLLIICILIVSIIFISGCTSDDKTNSETLTDSQSNQQSDSKTPDLILKSSDVPRLNLASSYSISYPESSELLFSDTYVGSMGGYIFFNGRVDENEIVDDLYHRRYKDILMLGQRKIGEYSRWSDEIGRSASVHYVGYDSNNNFPNATNHELYNMPIIEYLKFLEDSYDSANTPDMIGYEDPEIGDYSLLVETEINGVRNTWIGYTYNNYIVDIEVKDDKENSRIEALRIAKIVKNRLD